MYPSINPGNLTFFAMYVFRYDLCQSRTLAAMKIIETFS